MFSKSPTKTIGKVTGFIEELKETIELQEKEIDHKENTVKQINAEIHHLEMEKVVGENLLTNLTKLTQKGN